MKTEIMHIDGMYPVSAQPTADGWSGPQLSYDDYTRMSTQQRKQSGERRLATPLWSVNDKLLQELLVCFQEERAGFRKKQKGTLIERLERANAAIMNQRPRLITLLDKLCNEYVVVKRLGIAPETTDAEWNAARKQPYMPGYEGEAKFMAQKKRTRELEIEIEGIDTYLRCTNVGGGAGFIVSIVYLYYRAGLDSVGVGAQLGYKPPHIRQTLWRLFETAAKLWPEQVADKLGTAREYVTSVCANGGDNPQPGAENIQSEANRKTRNSSTGLGLAVPLPFCYN